MHTAQHAQTVRQIREEHPFHEGFIIQQTMRAAIKSCRCGRFTCSLCGMLQFQRRIDRIRISKIASGYLSGGFQNRGLK